MNHLEPPPRNQHAMAEERTLWELATAPVDEALLCINYPTLRVEFELKSRMIHLLPNFCGKENEDPYNHLKSFNVVCLKMRPQGILEERINLHAFPFL